jgi:hypothetical protein
MTYFRVDDRWEDDPRLARLRWTPLSTLLALWAYAIRDLTDVIPPSVPFRRFAKYVKTATAERDRALLIECGLIEETPEGGLRLVGFAEEQQIEYRRKRRDDEAARKRREREERKPSEGEKGDPGAVTGRPSRDRRATSRTPMVTRERDRRDPDSGAHTGNTRGVPADSESASAGTLDRDKARDRDRDRGYEQPQPQEHQLWENDVGKGPAREREKATTAGDEPPVDDPHDDSRPPSMYGPGAPS